MKTIGGTHLVEVEHQILTKRIVQRSYHIHYGQGILEEDAFTDTRE